MTTGILRTGSLFLAVSLLLLGSIGLLTDSQSLAAETREIHKIALKIQGMECRSCTKEIRKVLLKVPGVKSAEVRIVNAEEKTGQAAVECEKGKVTPEQLVKAVEGASNAMFTYTAIVVLEE